MNNASGALVWYAGKAIKHANCERTFVCVNVCMLTHKQPALFRISSESFAAADAVNVCAVVNAVDADVSATATAGWLSLSAMPASGGALQQCCVWVVVVCCRLVALRPANRFYAPQKRVIAEPKSVSTSTAADTAASNLVFIVFKFYYICLACGCSLCTCLMGDLRAAEADLCA